MKATRTKTLGTKKNPPVVEMVRHNSIQTELDEQVKLFRLARIRANAAKAELDAISDQIKSILTTANITAATGTDWEVKLTNYTQSRLDSKALKIALPDVYSQFERQTQCQRLTVN